MSGPLPHHQYTYADYLDHERGSDVKHEFFGGDIYAMAGGTPKHAALSVAMSASLSNQLAGKGCRVYSSDLRVRVLATGLATYPDVTVVCGPIETDPESDVTASNPRLLVELLSDSTESYDRGAKLVHYRTIPSLAVVVLVATRERVIEVHRRSPSGEWNASTFGAGTTATIPELGCELVVDDIYRLAEGS